MSGVSDKVLNWLYSVLTSEYRDVNRTYNDAAQVLSSYTSLAPRTEIYTYEDGSCALLLLISGTIPVSFRGTVYRYPIAIWVPQAYPREAPFVYVTPVDGMVVRPGQHVSSDGRVYHPYLAKWIGFWDISSLSDLIAILRDLFTKEPPVISKQVPQPIATSSAVTPLPPPKEWRRPQQASHQPTPFIHESRGDHLPPPRPPKGVDYPSDGGAEVARRASNQGPPLPPLPPQISQASTQSIHQWQNTTGGAQPRISIPQRQSSLENAPSPYNTPGNLPPRIRYQQGQHELESPVSPISPGWSQKQAIAHQPQYHDQYHGQSLPVQNHEHHQPHSQYQGQPLPAHTYQRPPQTVMQPMQSLPRPQPQKSRQPQVDLLTSPLDVQLPSQNEMTPLPVPPVPPNPQKDMLLHALSQALVGQSAKIISDNQAAFESLLAQQSALQTAQTTLQTELDQLAALTHVIDSNTSALQQAMRQADQVIADVAQRRRPEIDEVLVCPTVVGQQVYNAVAEEKAAGDVRVALGRGLDKGRISAKAFVTQMRAVGREEFFRKALVSKAGEGMGLEMSVQGGR